MTWCSETGLTRPYCLTFTAYILRGQSHNQMSQNNPVFFSAFVYRDLNHVQIPVNESLYGTALREEVPGFESRLCQDFSGLSHTSDLKNGTPVATLPGAWRYRFSAGTGQPVVSILWLGEIESVAVLQHVKLSEQIRPCDTLACCWDITLYGLLKIIWTWLRSF